ncbi:tRNA pseudouridine(55) synthase TruB [Raineyella sp. W15-4]|uniref:tRNA pseudouridine(55) synthase TruB n=1 Tax=Raineyella sp. W15-4 TaxID=3081651 RepID=UPI0029547F16|nr:tRNA pseudouridine(55) synthase TruB [Raineyella sp. W15-4]WOQ18331.1 tRNA pseudouridine(55) synthase TruB [Raineyella sp. W15-4]
MADARPEGPSGLLVIDKPAGLTSHDVVARARRILGTRKVGHAGTLDPMATGVLILGVGRATRLLGHLALHDKAYDATIRLGQVTLTDDAEGEVVASAGAVGLTDDAIRAAMATFTGAIAQRPSAVSAIKVDGKRSYARVRAGEQVELPARPVTVSRFDLLARRDAHADEVAVVDLDVTVECSTGTYVRALARDLGEALGTGGHLTALRRTRVGGFGLDTAQTLPERDAAVRAQDATAPDRGASTAPDRGASTAPDRDASAAPTGSSDDTDRPGLVVLPMDRAVRSCFPWLAVDEAAAREVGYGRALRGVTLPACLSALFGPDGTFLALYRQDGPDARPEAVFAPQ